jgi:uncharacterized protein (DUF1778 family)
VCTIGPMKKDNKTQIVKFRISKDDKELLKLAANSDRLTLSSWLVVLGRNRAKELGVTLETIDHPDQVIMPLA